MPRQVEEVLDVVLSELLGEARSTRPRPEADASEPPLEGGLGFYVDPNRAPGAPLPSGGSWGGDGSNIDQAVRAAYAAGFRGEALVNIVAIAGGESGWNPRAHNPNAGTGDNSYGLWQINMLGGMGPERRKNFGLKSNEELFDPVKNAQAAYALSGGGKNFGPWTVWKKGSYKAHLGKAREAVARLGAK